VIGALKHFSDLNLSVGIILVTMALCTGNKKAEEEEGTTGSPCQRFSLQVSSSFFIRI
jgi:hypothetical protein